MSGFIRVMAFAVVVVFCACLIASGAAIAAEWRLGVAAIGAGALVMALWTFRDWAEL